MKILTVIRSLNIVMDLIHLAYDSPNALTCLMILKETFWLVESSESEFRMTIDSVDESKVPSNDNNDSDVSSDEDDINLELENRTLQIAKKARLETDDSSSKKDTDDAQPDQKLIDLTGTDC